MHDDNNIKASPKIEDIISKADELLKGLDSTEESPASSSNSASIQDATGTPSLLREEDGSSFSESATDRKAQKVVDLNGGQNAWILLGILLLFFCLFSVFVNLNRERKPKWPWPHEAQKEQAERSKGEITECQAQYQKATSGTLKDTVLSREEYIKTIEKHRQAYDRCIKGWR